VNDINNKKATEEFKVRTGPRPGRCLHEAGQLVRRRWQPRHHVISQFILAMGDAVLRTAVKNLFFSKTVVDEKKDKVSWKGFAK
jgi:hypothetical protein